MTTVYSQSQEYLTGTSPDYPDSNVFTVLGPVLLPKIYGSNLSALEIASSGTIVLSLADVESITLSNDTVNKITTYQANDTDGTLSFQSADTNNTVKIGDHTWYSADDYQNLKMCVLIIVVPPVCTPIKQHFFSAGLSTHPKRGRVSQGDGHQRRRGI